MSKLSQITEKLENVQEEHDGFVARCPSHEDRHASLRVAVDDRGTVLLKCRAGCKTSDVVEAMGISFRDLFEVEMDMDVASFQAAEGPLSIGDRAKMMAYLTSCRDRLRLPVAEEALEYALERFGVDAELAEELGLGFDPGHGAERFELLGGTYHKAPRLVVPFLNADGVPVGFQARALTDTKVRWAGPINPPDGGSWSKLSFFQSGSGTDFVVITEGPGDALTAVAAGVDAVGIRGAAQVDHVAEELAEALQGRRVVLAGDADRAGELMNVALGQKLVDAGLNVHVLTLPPHVDDVTDWHESSRVHFAGEFQAAVFDSPQWTPPPPEEPEEELLENPEDEDDLPTTHVEVARLVIENMDGRLVYILGLGFHLYEAGVWSPDRLGKVRLEIHAIGDHYAEMIPDAEDAHRMALMRDDEMGAIRAQRLLRSLKRFVKFVRSTVELDRIEKEVKGLVKMDTSSFDRHPYLLAVRNGVVDLKTGDLLEHSKDYHLTQLVDVDYRPDAEAPRWEAFIQEVFPGAEGMADYVRRLVGYGITGDTTEQCFAVLWGRGANGKSVFTETLLDVFGGISKATPFDTFEDKQSGGIPNDIAALRGARLVFASEGERGKPMAESVIKRVTGQDMISARFMRQEFFEFRPSFLLFMASNHKPNFLSADEGLWRRVKMIPWARFFEPHERDPYLRQRMVADESEGILAWAVRGSVEWQTHGLGDPSTVVQATAAYRDSSDRLASFFPHGPIEPFEDGEVKGSEIWKLYLDWADDEMLPPKERWGRNTLYGGLEERGLVKARTMDGIVLRGCRIRGES